MNDFNEHNYLCHYGIKGMKWGMRRYQNPDGSLTPAGKARYGGGKAEEYRVKLLRKANKMNKHGEYENAIKKIKSVSNEELARELANRDKKAKRTGGYASLGAGAAAFIGNVAQVKAADDNGVTVAQTANVPLTMIVGYFAGKGTSKLSYTKNLINKYNETPVSKTKAKTTETQPKQKYSKKEKEQIRAEFVKLRDKASKNSNRPSNERVAESWKEAHDAIEKKYGKEIADEMYKTKASYFLFKRDLL